MKEILKQLMERSDQIVTLLSVVVGGIITYISTSASEKRKERREVKREKLDEILIPYCTCIEQVIPEIEKIYNFPPGIKINEFDMWLACFNKPLEYLNAGKRVYLSKKLRIELEQYKAKVTSFKKKLDEDYDKFDRKYSAYIREIAENYQCAPLSTYTYINFKKYKEIKMKMAILSQQDISMKDDITEVDYVLDADPDHYDSVPFYITDDLRTTWAEIQCGQSSAKDIIGEMEQWIIEFLDYVDEKTRDEKKVIADILGATESNQSLTELKEHLDVMHRDLITEIDRIAK